jgi:predicted DNA-binding transcriptional regulator AlpA
VTPQTKNSRPKRTQRRRERGAAIELPAELELERAIDSRQLSALVGIAENTLTQYRMNGEGPPFFRIGRNIRYRLGDVLAWRDAGAVGKRAG